MLYVLFDIILQSMVLYLEDISERYHGCAIFSQRDEDSQFCCGMSSSMYGSGGCWNYKLLNIKLAFHLLQLSLQ